MPKIFELEQHVADLIAAGEVVGRPASVVKELTENSVDAGAGIITVEISSGGMTYIRVSDNGCGIAREDVKTAFLRHATSKLKDARGLEAIGSLGFRGEALAAIAAVSKIELLTREYGAEEGVRLVLEAGTPVSMSPVGCPEGTTIIVRDLFYNTPARLKFMKTDRAEASAIASVVLRCALSRPEISFRFIKDGKTEYHTPGDSRIDSCVYSLLGRDIEAGLINIQSSGDDISVEGFISKPESARGNRSYQFFFINGRVIRSLLLQTAVEQAYKNSLSAGKFPACVLYITAKPNEIDVNVHPAKAEVKFVSEKQFFDSVYYAALGALDNRQLENQRTINNEQMTINNEQCTINNGLIENGNLKIENSGFIKSNDGISFNRLKSDDFQKSYVSEPVRPYVKADDSLNNHTFSVKNKTFEHNSDLPIFNCQLPDVNFIGEVLNVYLIVEYNDAVWIIDKHAAHERIRFDALKNQNYEPMSEALITPVICHVGHENASVLFENSDFLSRMGFSVESFGEDSVAIRYIPVEIDIDDTESVLSDLCMILKHGGAATPAQLDKVYKTIACKAAIKAGRSSTVHESEALARSVMSGEVTTCPHGRPVVFEITKSYLDKGFGRI